MLDQAVTTAEAVIFARDLANRPSNEKSPQWLAEQATGLARSAGLRVRVLDEQALERGDSVVCLRSAGALRTRRDSS